MHHRKPEYLQDRAHYVLCGTAHALAERVERLQICLCGRTKGTEISTNFMKNRSRENLSAAVKHVYHSSINYSKEFIAYL